MAGDTISLLSWGGLAAGVTTTGLKWALAGETLYPYKTRGISNEMLMDTATVCLGTGLLLCVHRRSTR
jgi:thiamine pyrophosphokinase